LTEVCCDVDKNWTHKNEDKDQNQAFMDEDKARTIAIKTKT